MSRRLLSLLLCALLLMLAVPAAVFADGEDEVEYYAVPYVIQNGDSFTRIYERWGLRFEKYAGRICAINAVEDLDVLFVGATYLLPTTAENLDTDVYVTVMSHQMRGGETAYDVLADYGIDYNENVELLQRFNGGRDLTKIQIGEKLLIPVV